VPQREALSRLLFVRPVCKNGQGFLLYRNCFTRRFIERFNLIGVLKMKKIFVIILLLVFSMPTFAAEVKLICSYKNISDTTNNEFPFTFDEEKNTCNLMNKTNCIFSDTSISVDNYYFTLSRVTGVLLVNGNDNLHAKCVRLQKAF
jgi:hypothetical protein